MRKKKGCPLERNLREIYIENNVGTTARPSFLVTTVLALEGAEAIAYWGGAQNFLGPRGVKYLNTGLSTVRQSRRLEFTIINLIHMVSSLFFRTYVNFELEEEI